MTAGERIAAIRLLDSIRRNPEYAARIGIGTEPGMVPGNAGRNAPVKKDRQRIAFT